MRIGREGPRVLMLYFWVIPLLFVLIVAIVFFRKSGTKRTEIGRSRLDEARSLD